MDGFKQMRVTVLQCAYNLRLAIRYFLPLLLLFMLNIIMNIGSATPIKIRCRVIEEIC